MDPLSDIIALLRPHDCVAAGFDAGGNWSIRFNGHEGMKCNAVIRGRCWLAADGAEPVNLEEGDCAILPRGRPFLLSSKPAQFGEDAQTIYEPVSHGGTAVYNGGGDFFMTGARFLLSGPAVMMLMRSLPPVIHVHPGPQQQTIRWVLDQIAAELRNCGPGSTLSITHLSHLLLLQVMRDHLSNSPPQIDGWLAALSDPPILAAVAALHDDPARAWTVQDLASTAALSRTSFAVRFRRVVGQTPIDYLMRWRILLAAEKLLHAGQPVAQVAADVGYASESAFTVAFKRTLGCTPRQYARDGRLLNSRGGAKTNAP